jgi:microcystin-dependent protein
MSTPFVGEIRMFAGTFNPRGWLLCNGALVSISQLEVLFVLIGTTYGGDGVNTFGLPNLQGRRPVHQGQGPGLSTYVIGTLAGSESVTLTAALLPVHTHAVSAVSASAATSTTPTGNLWATWSDDQYDTSGAPNATLASSAIGNSGGGNLPHSNISPFLAVNFIICTQGVFPSQN